MPNQPKTKTHSIRIDDDLWKAALERASERGESLPDAIRRYLKRYTR